VLKKQLGNWEYQTVTVDVHLKLAKLMVSN